MNWSNNSRTERTKSLVNPSGDSRGCRCSNAVSTEDDALSNLKSLWKERKLIQLYKCVFLSHQRRSWLSKAGYVDTWDKTMRQALSVTVSGYYQLFFGRPVCQSVTKFFHDAFCPCPPLGILNIRVFRNIFSSNVPSFFLSSVSLKWKIFRQI